MSVTLEAVATIGIPVIITVFYMLIGLGVGKMIAKIKGGNISIFTVCFWWLVCLIYVAFDDVNNV